MSQAIAMMMYREAEMTRKIVDDIVNRFRLLHILQMMLMRVILLQKVES